MRLHFFGVNPIKRFLKKRLNKFFIGDGTLPQISQNNTILNELTHKRQIKTILNIFKIYVFIGLSPGLIFYTQNILSFISESENKTAKER